MPPKERNIAMMGARSVGKCVVLFTFGTYIFSRSDSIHIFPEKAQRIYEIIYRMCFFPLF